MKKKISCYSKNRVGHFFHALILTSSSTSSLSLSLSLSLSDLFLFVGLSRVGLTFEQYALESVGGGAEQRERVVSVQLLAQDV